MDKLLKLVFRGAPGGTMALLHRLVTEHGKVHVKRYALAFGMMAVAAGCTALSAYLIRDVINQTYVHRNFTALAALCVVTIVLFTVKGLASYGQAVTLGRISNNIIAENQRRIFDKLLLQNVAFFADRHSSEFMARVSYSAGAAAGVLNLLITALGRDAITLIGLVTVMVIQDPLLSVVGLIIMPPAILVLRKLIKRVRGITLTQFGGGARILQVLQETIQGFRVIKAFGLEGEMRRRIASNIDDVERAANKLTRVSNRASPLMESLGGFAIALVFLYGGYRVLKTGATPGEFVSFLAAFLLAYEPAKRIARMNIELSSGLVGVQMLFEIQDAPLGEPNDADKPALQVGAGGIDFTDVSFAYRPGESVFERLSFSAQPGRVTALVGPSGSGKSTILNLILRLYEPQSGKISIDGQNILEVSRESVRRQIAYVGQDVFMFRGSIRDNIAFGRPGAGDEDIVEAAKAAYAHEFIMGFPTGYDTPVGEHGMQLSGGQRQRIAIARALIRNAPIILLDEPTAALDSESERYVQEAIARLCQGRTTLVIAHRFHTITHADMIYVIENGAIVDSGSHEALLRAKGRYADFFRLQVRDRPPERRTPQPVQSAG